MELKKLFELVDKEGASDLLLSAGAPPVLRVNGQLMRTKGDALTPEDSKKMIYSAMNAGQKKAFEERKELDFSLAVGRKHRFRVNVYYQKESVTAAFRPIPEEIPAWDELGLPDYVTELAMIKQGLVLVTGPTGHGKTTTQASIIDLINEKRACHVITVEDPIEYIHFHKRSIVDQREVGGDTHSFTDALKYVLRQDPDVILIGEMRDLETISAALRAAETGHLVMATLHTNDAIQSVDRIIDVFPPEGQQQIRFQLSMVLVAILSQRLLPRIDKDGRVMAYELLMNNTAIANLIREGKTHQVLSALETGQKAGMMTIDKSIINLYNQGIISYDEAASQMRNPKALK
ncbi:MAG: type IV pili twitching motility protein PilT [Candidatus Hydrogenedentota bacterium]|nr:MAG: type IV pili twitching motility protein PilT [Candidatus Hydrogenedentota bacterium]